MIFDMMAPPNVTGRWSRDVVRLYDWCRMLNNKLNRTFSSIDAGQITSGTLQLDNVNIVGGSVIIKPDYVFIGNSDNYIKFENGVLTVVTV